MEDNIFNVTDEHTDQNFPQVLNNDNFQEPKNDEILQTIKMLLQNEKVLKTTHGAALTIENEGDKRFKYFPQLPLDNANINYPIPIVQNAQNWIMSNEPNENHLNETLREFSSKPNNLKVNNDFNTMDNISIKKDCKIMRKHQKAFRWTPSANTIKNFDHLRFPLTKISQQTDKIVNFHLQTQKKSSRNNCNRLSKPNGCNALIIPIPRLSDYLLIDKSYECNSRSTNQNTTGNKSIIKNHCLNSRNWSSAFLGAIALAKKRCSFCKQNSTIFVIEDLMKRFETISNKFFLRDLEIYMQNILCGFIHISVYDTVTELPVYCVLTNEYGLQEAIEFGLYDSYEVHGRTCDL